MLAIAPTHCTDNGRSAAGMVTETCEVGHGLHGLAGMLVVIGALQRVDVDRTGGVMRAVMASELTGRSSRSRPG